MKGAAVNATTAIADGVSSLLGGSKVKRLEAENEGLKQDIANLQRQVQAEQREQTKMENRHNSEINKIDRSYQQKIAGYDNRLKQIDTYFPIVTELLPIAEQCREVGFTEELTRRIVSLQPVGVQGQALFEGTQGEVQDGALNGNRREKPAGEWEIQAVY